MKLTPQGHEIVEEIARRHGFSIDAVGLMLRSVISGGGTMAQFSHPEFGGSGQWMQGGMTMIGDMFNNALKARVDSLCCELSALMASQPLFEQPAQTQVQHPGSRGGTSLFEGRSDDQWWPAELGLPSSSGSQNTSRYAVFPNMHRLAVEIDGQVTVYDTLDHQIGGVGQQQGSGIPLSFSSQYGQVNLGALPIVLGTGAKPKEEGPADWSTEAVASGQPVVSEEEIFAKIERLAELQQKGILSDEEFSNKKAELLSRI